MKIGELEVITFRTTRRDQNYGPAIDGLATGTSSGHVALRLNFKSKELFDQYVNGNRKIPHKIIKNPITNEETYEVYISFWPEGEWGFTSNAGIFQQYQFDCEQSANFTPMEYDPIFAEYLNPLRKNVAPRLPIGSSYLQQQITLPPAIMLHTTRLGMAFGKRDSKNLLPTPNESVMQAAEQYAKSYREWRGWVIMKQNLEFLSGKDNPLAQRAENIMLATRARNYIDEINLRNAMYPGIKISHDDFMDKLEPFITFGLPERDSAKIPLISLHTSNEKVYGLELEPILQLIKEIADNPSNNPYHLIHNNCSNVIEKILLQGNQKELHKGLTQHFNQHQNQKIMSINTPTMLLKSTIRAQQVLSRLSSTTALSELVADNTESLPTFKEMITTFASSIKDYLFNIIGTNYNSTNRQEDNNSQLPLGRTEIFLALLIEAHRFVSNLSAKNADDARENQEQSTQTCDAKQPLIFSRSNSSDSENELPTSKAEIFASLALEGLKMFNRR